MKEQIINFLRNKKILILGFGREGKSSLNFIRQNLPDAEVAIADQNQIDDPDVVNITTSEINGLLGTNYDDKLIVKTLENVGFVVQCGAELEVVEDAPIMDGIQKYCPICDKYFIEDRFHNLTEVPDYDPALEDLDDDEYEGE